MGDEVSYWLSEVNQFLSWIVQISFYFCSIKVLSTEHIWNEVTSYQNVMIEYSKKNSSVEAKIPIDRQSWYNCVSLIKQIDRGIGENKELFNSKQSDCRHVFYVVMRK